MNGGMSEQLTKGSVRSLPKGQLQNIRRMFDRQCEQDNSSQLSNTGKVMILIKTLKL